jgi:CheY-like chemotaxis protein
MEAIGTLAGGIAHDFNNILTPIIVQSELAQLTIAKDHPAQSSLEEVLKAGHRARDLVRQILAFSRRSEQQRMPIDMVPIVKEGIKLLRSSIPKTIAFQQNIKADSATIEGDPTQIHQILMNLCANAAHAMRESGGVLNISLENVDIDHEAGTEHMDLGAGPYVRLAVSDTGQGMDRFTLSRAFDPFFTTKGRSEGTGMGLAVVHGIVKSYGGTIRTESVIGRGTTFEIFLPRTEKKTLREAEKPSGLPVGTERILLVDDEKSMVDAVRMMLDRLGYKVVASTSSIEALGAFRVDPQRFDLVITDMTMPNMTGRELANEIMTIRADIPIVLCTGFSEQIDEDTARAMGIREFVMKPIVMKEMAETIRRVLGQESTPEIKE